MNKTTTFATVATALTLGLASISSAQAKDDLSLTVYNAPASSFGVNSTLISGEKEAILLDTGFTRSDAYRIAANVLDSGKQLKSIVISQADPDYYFGAEVLHEIFPNLRPTAGIRAAVARRSESGSSGFNLNSTCRMA